MAFFEWTDELSVKIKEIDDQHKKLIDMINDFYDGIQNKASKDNLVNLISSMADYTVYHFEKEESYMVKFNYENIDEHHKLHKGFVDKVLDLKNRLDTGKLVISIEVTSFLKDWLKEHIMGEDPKYVELFQKNGVK